VRATNKDLREKAQEMNASLDERVGSTDPGHQGPMLDGEKVAATMPTPTQRSNHQYDEVMPIERQLLN
jgi:hypothetical protein